jgi:hypothetical protein
MLLTEISYNIDDPNIQAKEGDRTQYSYLLNKNHYSLMFHQRLISTNGM